MQEIREGKYPVGGTAFLFFVTEFLNQWCKIRSHGVNPNLY